MCLAELNDGSHTGSENYEQYQTWGKKDKRYLYCCTCTNNCNHFFVMYPQH